MSRRVNFIDEYPITLNMAVERPFPFTMKRVVMAFRRQGFFPNNHAHYFNKFINILMAFFSQNKVFLKFAGTERIKHELTPQILKQILKRLEPLGGNLAPHHGPALPNSGGSLGVGGVAFGAQRTFTFKIKTVISGNGAGCRPCQSIGKINPPHRYFGGYVNSQPVAGRHFYGLGNVHKENIA
jgi:hypothetical protein